MKQIELAQRIIGSGGHCCDISCSGKPKIYDHHRYYAPSINPGVVCPLQKVDCTGTVNKALQAKIWLLDHITEKREWNQLAKEIYDEMGVI